MSDIAVLFVIVLATIALFVWNRLPLVVVAMGSALALYATGILSLNEVFVGFGDPVVMFVASLFIVTAGLEATGVTAWIGQQFERVVAGDPYRLLVIGVVAVALLCPLINASGAIGTLMPVVMLMVVRLGEQPSRFLMPMAFASGAGAHLALTGAPKNVLIADAAGDYAGRDLNFFEFALVGIPLLVGTVAIVLLLGRLVPQRTAPSLPRDLSRHAKTLVQQYRLARDVFVLALHRASPLAGTPVTALPLDADLSLVMVSDADGAPRLDGALAPGDRVVVRGTPEAAGRFADAHGLQVREISGEEAAGKLINRMAGVAEAVIPQRSQLIGEKVFPGMVTAAGDLVVLAIQRRGEDLVGEVTLEAGDHLLIQGTWSALQRNEARDGVLIVDRPDAVRRQLVPLGSGAKSVLAIVAAMVVAIASGALPPAVATVLAAGAILVLGLLTVEDAFRSINWTTVILIAAMFPLSTALVQTGAAQLVADSVVALTGAGSPRLLLAMIFVLAVVMGVVVSNTATTMILLPITVMSAAAFGISPFPALMALSVATSASFLTPVSTTSNTMVMGPAGYRFADYWPLGLPLTAFYFVVAVWLVPVIWPF
ncbi:MAG: SLC13 family permease [Rhodobacteraceae bacterium]|jgi:di/tricarboxylate transporter|nr:SLC13 family permease [Paracoccaceae bacterium]